MKNLQITESVLKAIGDDRTVIKRLQVLSDEQINQDDVLSLLYGDKKTILSHYDTGTQIDDLIISKTVLIQSFIECYEYLYKLNPELRNRHDTYTASLGILLSSAEDCTAIRISESIVKEMAAYDVLSTFRVISCYLTCSIDRTNKGSALWLYAMKLSLLLLKEQIIDLETFSNWMIRIIYQSLKVHPRNYHACNTFRFVIALIRATGKKWLLQGISESLFKYLQKDGIDDTSMWLVWTQLLLEIDSEDFYVSEGIRIGFPTYLIGSKSVIAETELNKIYRQLTSWLQSSNYPYYPGWLVGLLLSKHLGKSTTLIQKMKEKVIEFEKINHIKIDVNTDEVCTDFYKDAYKLESVRLCMIFKKLYSNQWASYLT